MFKKIFFLNIALMFISTHIYAVQSMKINIGHSGAPGGFADIASVEFKRLVEVRSNNNIKVTVFPSGQLGGERELVEGAQLGTVDIAVVLAGILESFEPQFGVLNLPYLFNNRKHAFDVFDGSVGRSLMNLLSKHNLKGYAFGEFGFRSMMIGPRAVYSPNDVAGLKFRVPESDIYISMYKSIGATPVPLPGPEIFTSLQNKVIDGTGAPIFAAVTAKYYETPLKHLSLTEHIYAALLMVGSKQMWDKMDSSTKKLIQKASLDAVAHQRNLSIQNDQMYIDTLLDKGWKINLVNKKPFRSMVSGMYVKRSNLKNWVNKIKSVGK